MSMCCDFCKDKNLLNDYILNQLSETEKKRFEHHYFECDTCFQELLVRKETVQLLKEEGAELFSDYLATDKKPAKEKPTMQIFRLPRCRGHYQPNPSLVKSWLHKGLLPAFVTVALFIVLIGSFFTYQEISNRNLAASIRYDKQVPYEFVPHYRSELRGVTTALFNTFQRIFEEGMLEYSDLNYSKTIQILETLKNRAELLVVSNQDKEELSLIRDYYFYLGVTYLAQARSTVAELTDEQKQIYLLRSRSNLDQAQKMASEHQLDDIDRDVYFLALVYGFTGKHDSTHALLQKMTPDSPFQSRLAKISKEWAKKQ